MNYGRATPLTISQAIALQDKMIETLRTCYDPEIPVNIYDLGLIYEAKVDTSRPCDREDDLDRSGLPCGGLAAGRSGRQDHRPSRRSER